MIDIFIVWSIARNHINNIHHENYDNLPENEKYHGADLTYYILVIRGVWLQKKNVEVAPYNAVWKRYERKIVIRMSE